MTRIPLLLSLALLGGCAAVSPFGDTTGDDANSGRPADDAGTGDDAQQGDTGTTDDAGDDAEGGQDADRDAQTDTGTDAGTDDSGAGDSGAGDGTGDNDATTDGATDAAGDATSDTLPDTAPDSGPDSGTDSGPDSGTDSGTDALDDDADDDAGPCAAESAVATSALAPVDIIWVVDSSPSMDDSIDILEANINAFAASIGSSGLDYRVVLIGADREIIGTSQDFTAVCVPPPLSGAPGCPDTDSDRFLHIRRGVHSADGIDFAIEEFSNYRSFLRPGAITHFVFVTDDNVGWSPGAPEFETFIASATSPAFGEVHVHSIVNLVTYVDGCGIWDDEPCSCGDDRSQDYIDLSTRFDGLVHSICETDWSPIFTALESRVVEGTSLPCAYAIPEVDRELEIDRVNVVLVAEDGTRTLVPNVDTAADCTGAAWFYNDPVDPTSVELCPAACLGVSGSVELEFGCRTIKE